ncbi:hypothetical protein GCM10009849_35400 [Sinomonas flava]|uniref:Uncharacterized protein n=1 Tax=Sinomonas flava TaxID=496857 RepID=A0ABN3C2B7_9MICC
MGSGRVSSVISPWRARTAARIRRGSPGVVAAGLVGLAEVVMAGPSEVEEGGDAGLLDGAE